jgi:hypothetical protein
MPPRKPVPSRSEPFDFWIDLVTHPERNRTGYQFFEGAAGFPFEGGASGFSKVNVAWLADAALLSYFPDSQAVEAYRGAGLTCVPLSVGATQCHLAFQDDLAIVAFRGTQSDQWGDIFDDARFAMVEWTLGQRQGNVHGGFFDAFHRIQEKLGEELKKRPGSKLWLTGHSLGAALATLAAGTFPNTHGAYTFGSPLVGDQTFASHFNSHLPGRSFRYVDDHDFVIRLPPPSFGYVHVDEPRWIGADGTIGTTAPPPKPSAPGQSTAHRSLLRRLLDIGAEIAELETRLELEAVGALDAFKDHAPVLYATHAWNALP